MKSLSVQHAVCDINADRIAGAQIQELETIRDVIGRVLPRCRVLHGVFLSPGLDVEVREVLEAGDGSGIGTLPDTVDDPCSVTQNC